MLVVVAVQAQQLPVAAVGRVVVVIMVAVMHGQLLHVGAREFAHAAPADPRIHFQGTFAVAALALVGGAARFGDDFVQPGRVGLFSLHGKQLSRWEGEAAILAPAPAKLAAAAASCHGWTTFLA